MSGFDSWYHMISGADTMSGSSMFNDSRSAIGSSFRIDTRGSRGKSGIDGFGIGPGPAGP